LLAAWARAGTVGWKGCANHDFRWQHVIHESFYSKSVHQSNSITKVGLRVARDAQHTRMLGSRSDWKSGSCVNVQSRQLFFVSLESIPHDLLDVWEQRHFCEDIRIFFVALGRLFVLPSDALFEKKRSRAMYFWGAFDFAAPTVAKDPVLSYPVRYPSLPIDPSARVSQAASGLKFLVILTSDGKLFGLGSNHSQQLGTSVGTYTNTVRQLTLETRFPVVQLACGNKHTLLRCSDGSVYSAGDNSFGQLGRKSKTKDFAQVQLPANITSIACGSETSFAVNNMGQVFSWGNAEFGNLGHGDKGERVHPVTLQEVTENVEIPKVVEWFVKKKISIVAVSAGKGHTLFQSQQEVYACGEGSFGKLGNGDVGSVVVPTRVEFPMRKEPEELLEVAAGEHHSLVRKRNALQQSVVYFFGKPGGNPDGQLTPLVVPEAPLNVTALRAGRQVSMGTTSDGRVFSWGVWPTQRFMGHTKEATLTIPSFFSLLSDFHVTHIVGGGGVIAAFADDTKARRACLDIVVPFADRGDSDLAQRYETFAQQFYHKVLGEGPGAHYFSQIPPAPPIPEKERPTYTKRGASVLSSGAKVRLWMSDVYALATVSDLAAAGTDAHNGSRQRQQKATQEATPPVAAAAVIDGNRKFLLEWARDDWYPELIELDSDDETLNEENPNRWQHGWFLEPPVSDGC
jgi:hypothetical protein